MQLKEREAIESHAYQKMCGPSNNNSNNKDIKMHQPSPNIKRKVENKNGNAVKNDELLKNKAIEREREKKRID